ncbi:MAG: AbrB/MazE/SpoVT family DNA-binding domain-containing protein [Candidatus Woesearchaeota archaeon]
MKATGITRGIDQVGRVVVPKEIRQALGLLENTKVEFLIDPEEERLIIQKYQKGCNFCGEIGNLIQHETKEVCKKCIENMFEKTKH